MDFATLPSCLPPLFFAKPHVPRGFAHGYQSLSDGATAFYMVSAAYAPGAEGGLRFDDPAIGIRWPMAVTDHSDKDGKWPLLERQE